MRVVNELESSLRTAHEASSGQVLVIRAGGMLACIDLYAVERTFSLVELQPVPGSAPWVAGIMNYAGSSIAVVDIALRLALPVQPYRIETPIIVCSWQSQRIGLIVSDIVGNQMPAPGDVQLSGSFRKPGSSFSASVHTPLGLAFMLDTDWLLSTEIYECSVAPTEWLSQKGGSLLQAGAN